MNQVGAIKKEIERLKDWTDANFISNDFYDGAMGALLSLTSFIESLEKEQFAGETMMEKDKIDTAFTRMMEKEQEPKGYDEAYLKEKIALAKKNGSWKEEQPEGLDSEEDNLARFAMYWYGDDKRRVYLSNVFVGESMRHKGEGTFILNAAEAIAKMAFADEILLKVKKGSFAYDWYKRHGYVDDETDEEDKTMIWMKKEV